MKKGLLKLFFIASILGGYANNLQAQTSMSSDTAKTGQTDTPPDTLRLPAQNLDNDMASFFQRLGLEPVVTRPSGKNNAGYFLHPNDVLELPKNVALVVFQNTPAEDSTMRNTGNLLIPDGMDDTASPAEIIRATGSVAFFRVDSASSKLTRENLIGYSIVTDWNYGNDNTTVSRREVYMLSTHRNYSARFTTDGNLVEVDKVKMIEGLGASPKMTPGVPPILRSW